MLATVIQGIRALFQTLSLFFRAWQQGTPQQAYLQVPNLIPSLPWLAYDSKAQALVLEDGRSLAGFLKLTDCPSDMLSLEGLMALRKKIMLLFQGIIPCDAESPWTLQVYLEDEPDLTELLAAFDQKVRLQSHPFTQAYRACLKEHWEYLSQSGGIFKDRQTNQNFRLKKRCIRLCLYRRLPDLKLKRLYHLSNSSESVELNHILAAIRDHLSDLGAQVQRMSGSDIFSWLFAWFNPGGSRPVPEFHQEQPYGFDWSEQIFCSTIEGHAKEGAWCFNQVWHQWLRLDALTQIPNLAHLSSALKGGSYHLGLLDRLPEGSRLSFSVVMIAPDEIAKHINRVKKSCVGDHAEAQLTRTSTEQALLQHEEGNYLFPCLMGVYLSAASLLELKVQLKEVSSLMLQQGFKMVLPSQEVYPLKTYFMGLPANYRYDWEKKLRLSRLIYAQQIACLLPLYGQYKASGKMCLSYFTRSGESFSFDPFDTTDKAANSHLLFLAETGGGKSAALVYHLLQVIALYQPKVFIIEAGDSFKLVCDYAEFYSLKVNQVKLSLAAPTALNPFAELMKACQLSKSKDGLVRDYLGEMVLAAHLMITGGDPKEEARMTRANQAILLKALKQAGHLALQKGLPEVITEQVVESLMLLAQQETNRDQSLRIQEMADAMSHFVQDPFSSSFFNREGRPWPEADITRLDMGLMKDPQYSAELAIAVMSMLSQITTQAEQGQYGDRMTLVLIDEAHVLTKNPLTARAITQFSKMCRKLGMWLWLATQNVSDFPEESKKMLSMIEFWIGLGTSLQEIDEISRYKSITDNEKKLFMSLRKEIPHYVEGIVLGRKIRGLFRNIPPRLALALGMSEQTEKAVRAEIMQKEGVSEVQAAIRVANQLMKKL